MGKRAKITLICCLAAVPLLLIAAFLLVALPYINAASSMPEGASLAFFDLGGGDYRLEWSEGENAARYKLTLDGADAASAAVLDSNSTVLENLTEGEHSFTVTPLGSWSLFGREHLREGEPLSITVPVISVQPPEVEWTPDDEAQTLTAVAEPMVGRSYELRRVEDADAAPPEGEHVLCSGDGALSVAFGEGGLKIPEYGEDYLFTLRAVVSGEGYTITGRGSEPYALEREALLPDVSELTFEAVRTNDFRLSWTEAKGDYYLVQQLTDGEWRTIAQLDCTDELSYETGTLASCRSYSFRVVGADEGAEEGAYVSSSNELHETTERSPLYCTVWPLSAMAFYAEADAGSERLEDIPAATALCVLAEENGFFRVRYAGNYGYIDSNYCLINLPEYLGELLSFDITNSYASKYAVHGYEIPEVTGEVVYGYEKVQLADGQFLAPYLYPCCDKLYEAANAALAQGYRLKIYDSYRPNAATRDIFDKAALLADQPVPELDIHGEVPEELPELAEGETLTYRRLWEEGSYGLPNFLAQNGSMHNMGIALDLTLERVDNGEELEMQTEMHDLSIYSILARNNQEAVLLDSIMKGAGFGGLTSEWWHFQDNETRQALSLNTYMWNGVSCACWVADDTGWRYRNADGSFVAGAEREIDGASWSFDERGYCEYFDTEARPEEG